MHLTKFLNNNETLSLFKSYGENLSRVFSSEKAHFLLNHNNSNFITEHLSNAIRPFKNQDLKILNDLIKLKFLQVETKYPKSGEIFLNFIINFLKNIQKFDNFSLNQELNNFLFFLNQNLETLSKNNISFKKLKQIVFNDINDKKITKILEEVISLVGIECKIFIETTKVEKTYIELFNGFNFNLETFNPNNKWEKNNPKVFIVDGIIANVHEIDQILVGASIKKEPLIIFAKDFENEILTTVQTNNLKGIFDIFLVKIPIEIETLNVINDVAAACGTDIVSTLKGNILSNISFDTLTEIDFVSCFKNNILIKNSKTKSRVAVSINQLIKSRNMQNDITLIKMFNDRIKSLTSSFATIKVASVSPQEKISNIEKIDKSLRLFNSLVKFGIFDEEIFNKKLKENKKFNMLFLLLENIFRSNTDYSAKSAIKGLLQGTSCAIDFLKINGMVLIERDLF